VTSRIQPSGAAAVKTLPARRTPPQAPRWPAPSAWLVVQCPSARHCAGVVVNPATGTRRILPGEAARPGWLPGITAPDGKYAAVPGYGPDQTAILHLVNLSTGSDRQVAIVPAPQGSPGLAWSPDSRWLFAATEDGALRAIDARTGQVRGLGVPLPPVTYLAVRSTGSPACWPERRSAGGRDYVTVTISALADAVDVAQALTVARDASRHDIESPAGRPQKTPPLHA
jgi:hypothetical protein